MTTPITEAAAAAAEADRPRSEALLPPAIILLVFAMVVIAIGGFAFIGGQQNILNGLRGDADAMREASRVLAHTEASAARVIAGDRNAMPDFFRNLDRLQAVRGETFDRVGGVTTSLDALIEDWGTAASVAADGHPDTARAVLA